MAFIDVTNVSARPRPSGGLEISVLLPAAVQ
jgi:hypothetical protein